MEFEIEEGRDGERRKARDMSEILGADWLKRTSVFFFPGSSLDKCVALAA